MGVCLNSVGMITLRDRVKLGADGGDKVERCFVQGRSRGNFPERWDDCGKFLDD